MLGLLALAMGGVLAGSFFMAENEDDAAHSGSDDFSDDEPNSVNLDLLNDPAGSAEPTNSVDVAADIQITGDVDGQIVFDMSADAHTPVGYTNIIGMNATYVVDEGELQIVDLGAGDNYLEVTNGAAVITTGEGQDTVDASGLVAGEIHAGAGDIVYGSNVGSGASGIASVAVNAHGAEFYGGDANELAVATGDGAVLDGGGGNDHLAAFEGNAELRGGAGDDWLMGNVTSDLFEQNSRVSDINSVTNASWDTLDGGDGADRLLLSNGDVGTGGEGADTFEIYYSDDRSPVAARILDFSPSEDALVVYVGGGEPDSPEDASYDLSDRVGLTDLDTGTEILVDGVTVAIVDGVTELRVGIPLVDADSKNPGPDAQYIDAKSGELADIDAFDIIVKVYRTSSS